MLVTVGDVRRHLGGITIPDGMTSVLEDVIARAQKMVETYLNRPVEKVQVRELARADSKGYLYLSVTPVWKVISCGSATAQDSVTSTEPYTVVPDESLGDNPRVIDQVGSVLSNGWDVSYGRVRSNTFIPGKRYAVEYIGGLDPAQIDDIKRVILQVSAREWGMYNIPAAGLQGGTPNMAEPQDTRGLSLSDDERRMIQRYKRRVAR